MFGGGSTSEAAKTETDSKSEKRLSSPESTSTGARSLTPIKTPDQAASGEKRSGNGSPPSQNDSVVTVDKKRRSSIVGSKANSLLSSAKNSFNFSQSGRANSELNAQSSLQKFGKQDPALIVPQGQQNNSAGESVPGPKSTFRVGVWEDRNKKYRRTMEDTHAFLYNFLETPVSFTTAMQKERLGRETEMVQSDNGYFAIFDGHAGTFAADWCGKKLHIILEDMIRLNPTAAIPELLDQTFTTVDSQLEKLPLKNSGCTAAIAILRWEDRVRSDRSATGSLPVASAVVAVKGSMGKPNPDARHVGKDTEACVTGSDTAGAPPVDGTLTRLKTCASRQRVLYTANVGDARIILCRGGKALRLSYDHKGSDENEGKRIANAGGLIVNNRVNGVLAVTRALGDAYMKDLVTGHPYTTETVIQTDLDEFIIIACDGLWDVCSDQEAVDLVLNVKDPTAASKQLVDHALSHFSTDNLSCMIVRFDRDAASRKQYDKRRGSVEAGNAASIVSEVEKIIMDTRQKIVDESSPVVGVSASNSGRGYEPAAPSEGEFVPTMLDKAVEEEPEVNGKDDRPKSAVEIAEMVAINPELEEEAGS